MGSILWIDMEDSTYVDRTLDLYRGVKSRHPKIGLAIQAYLRRTPADIQSLLPLRPIIRLVKGAYAEPAHVAFPEKADTDLAFYQLADTLLQAAARNEALPIFGTHDMRLVDRITGRAKELGVADGGYEIHMLYGVRMAEQRHAREGGAQSGDADQLRQRLVALVHADAWPSGRRTCGSCVKSLVS